MGLETGTTVNDLVATNPLAGDPRSEGDDHIRLVKTALKTCFPGLAGATDRVQGKAVGYTVAVTDTQTLIQCTAAITLSSVAAATAGNGFAFAILADGFDVVFDPNGAELVNGAATATVGAGDYALVRCTGTAWLLESMGNKIHSAASKTPLVDADESGWWDSVGGKLVKVTLTNLKATLKTYFDTLYTAIGSASGAPGVIPITASVVGNALTLTLNPTTLDFRSATIGSGTVNTRTVAAAISTVISSGSTGGTVSATAARLWLAAIDNAGTVELAWMNTQLGNGQIAAINESTLISTTAEGGAGAADSAGVWYSTTARSNVPFRLVGYVECTEATAGAWATAPSVIQGMGAGIKRPGDIIQVVNFITGAYATGSTAIPFDDTIPQNTEGDQYMSLAITPTSGINLLVNDVQFFAAHVSSNYHLVALFRDSVANALGVSVGTENLADTPISNTLSVVNSAGSAASTTFKVRSGNAAATPVYFNGTSAGRMLGGMATSSMKITEVMA